MLLTSAEQTFNLALLYIYFHNVLALFILGGGFTKGCRGNKGMVGVVCIILKAHTHLKTPIFLPVHTCLFFFVHSTCYWFLQSDTFYVGILSIGNFSEAKIKRKRW